MTIPTGPAIADRKVRVRLTDEDEVHPSPGIGPVGPGVHGSSLDDHVPGLHLDRLAFLDDTEGC
jgi:hypothetical protein